MDKTMFEGQSMPSEVDDKTTVAMTTRLTAAYLQGNALAVTDVAGLIKTIYTALCSAEQSNQTPAAAVPAVPVKKSITQEQIFCLECGAQHQMLKRHLSTAHDLSVDDYRAKWSLPADYPMTAPDYAARRSALARESGLGHKKDAVATTANGGRKQKGGHRYPASRWSKTGQ